MLFPGSRANRRKRADLFDAALVEARKEMPSLRDVALEGLSREDAALALNAADVMLMTSDREGSPVTVRESLACMTPVVSVEVGDVPEVLAGLPGCSIRPRDPAELAAGILEALRSARRCKNIATVEDIVRPAESDRSDYAQGFALGWDLAGSFLDSDERCDELPAVFEIGEVGIGAAIRAVSKCERRPGLGLAADHVCLRPSQ